MLLKIYFYNLKTFYVYKNFLIKILCYKNFSIINFRKNFSRKILFLQNFQKTRFLGGARFPDLPVITGRKKVVTSKIVTKIVNFWKCKIIAQKIL